jgi:hypothetical protein
MKSHLNNHFAPAIVTQRGCGFSVVQAARHGGLSRPWFARLMRREGGSLS